MTPESEHDQAVEEFWDRLTDLVVKVVSAEFDRRNAELLEKLERA